jgi:hypothetical protein
MKAAPIPLTQQEVDAMASGGKAAARVRQRLRTAPAAGSRAAGPVTDKAAPAPISRREIAAIQSGRTPAAVRRRISQSPLPRAEVPPDSSDAKAAPSTRPAKKKSSRHPAA